MVDTRITPSHRRYKAGKRDPLTKTRSMRGRDEGFDLSNVPQLPFHRKSNMPVTPTRDRYLDLLRGSIAALGDLAEVFSHELDHRTDRQIRVEPEQIVATIYVAGASGLKALALALRREYRLAPDESKLYKIGVVARTRSQEHEGSQGYEDSLDLEGRLMALGRDRYGSVQIDAWGGAKAHDGHSSWTLAPLNIKHLPEDPALTVGARTIDVVLPAGCKLRAFDHALHRVLQHRALDARFPLAARSTAYRDAPPRARESDMPGAIRLSRARELYLIDPIREGDGLLAMVEQALTSVRAASLRSEDETDCRSRPVQHELLPQGSARRESVDQLRSLVLAMPPTLHSDHTWTCDNEHAGATYAENENESARGAHRSRYAIKDLVKSDRPNSGRAFPSHDPDARETDRRERHTNNTMSKVQRRAMHARLAVAARKAARPRN